MKRWLVLLLVLGFSSLACSITMNLPEIPVPTIQTGEVQVMEINEPLPTAVEEPFKVRLDMGLGKLNLRGGASGLMEGTIRYNVPDWKPTVTRGQSSFVILQQTGDNLGLPKDTINEWNLQLGNVPMDLTINAGAYEGQLDLSGIPLSRLQISDGASKAEVLFNAPNPVLMSLLHYRTGASEVKLLNLGYANARQIVFEGGTGSYTLDFSGGLLQETTLQIKSGVSQVSLIVSQDTPARIRISGGLNNVSPKGTWSINDGVYEKSGSGPMLNVEIQMGVGSLELISQ